MIIHRSHLIIIAIVIVIVIAYIAYYNYDSDSNIMCSKVAVEYVMNNQYCTATENLRWADSLEYAEEMYYKYACLAVVKDSDRLRKKAWKYHRQRIELWHRDFEYGRCGVSE